MKTYGIFLSNEQTPPSVLLEHCTQNIKNARALSKSQKVFAVYQIAEGMKYIHHKNLIHANLKPSNVAIASDGTIKICDFGISKRTPNSFTAPEIANDEQFNGKADVYSFGILTFYILSGCRVPGINVSMPNNFTDFAKDLINLCWNCDSSIRPSFTEIIQQMEVNQYKLLDLSESEKNDILSLIRQHKTKIPHYS